MRSLMLFDETLGIDMDEMIFACLTGLLGKATKNFPVKNIDSDAYESEFSWKLDDNGYPTELIMKENNYEGTVLFTW